MSATSLLVFSRCAGFAFRAPGFSHPCVSPPLRAGLALFLTVAIASGVRSPAAHLGGIAFLAVLAFEFLLGSAIGIAASLVYDGAYAGGRAVDDYVGVKAIAPSLQLVAPSGFGRIWSLAYTAAFFLTGAYRITILGFAHSFERAVPGVPVDAHAWASYGFGLAGTIVLVGATVAAPAIALAFVVQIGLGALSRAIPRFGSLTLAFPLAFAAALIATAVAVPLLSQADVGPVFGMPAPP